jgi:hypothetical protein
VDDLSIELITQSYFLESMQAEESSRPQGDEDMNIGSQTADDNTTGALFDTVSIWDKPLRGLRLEPCNDCRSY